MVELLLVIAAVACATHAIRADRLLNAALWLAGASAFMAMIFYSLGAREAAIIELSVGAGLVTVLFVFAISVAGDESIEGKPAVPRALAAMLAGLCIIGLIWLLRDIVAPAPTAASASTLTTVLWHDRALDVLVQVALIFTGVIGLLGLLAEPRAAQTSASMAALGSPALASPAACPTGQAAASPALASLALASPAACPTDQAAASPALASLALASPAACPTDQAAASPALASPAACPTESVEVEKEAARL